MEAATGVRLAQETVDHFRRAEPTKANRASLQYWRRVVHIEKRKEIERDEFERWYCEDAARDGFPLPNGISGLRKGNGYGNHRVALNAKWDAWQARSALAYLIRT